MPWSKMDGVLYDIISWNSNRENKTTVSNDIQWSMVVIASKILQHACTVNQLQQYSKIETTRSRKRNSQT